MHTSERDDCSIGATCDYCGKSDETAYPGGGVRSRWIPFGSNDRRTLAITDDTGRRVLLVPLPEGEDLDFCSETCAVLFFAFAISNELDNVRQERAEA